MLHHKQGKWTQAAHGEWAQDTPETGWKTIEESGVILKAIHPTYPSLDHDEEWQKAS